MPSPIGDLLELRGLTKGYGGALALEGVSLSFRAGEIHALVGENGAGKSTLIRLCTGVHQPDAGEILCAGSPLLLRDPQQARRAGIRAVYQEAEFFPDLSLAENLMHAEGVATHSPFWLNWDRVRQRAEHELRALAVDLPVTVPAATLSVGQRMMAEIAGCLANRSRLLFLDEPTASLSVSESETLFAHLLRVRATGTAIVYVSHRLDEVLRLADRITVLRNGRVVATGPRAEFDRDRLVREMVGREPVAQAAASPAVVGEAILALKDVSDPRGRFRDVTLSLKTGEIVALYGLVGAGRSELGRALVGLAPVKGQMTLRGASFRPRAPDAAMRGGVAMVPEDRRTQGLFPTHPCRENITAPWLGRLGFAGFFSVGRERRRALAIATELDARGRDIDQPVVTLSGGNQQKIILGRWLATAPEVLIVDEPTRGVDVGAKAEIHARLLAFARRGRAVLLISSDLPEVLALGDRVCVMREGQLNGEFSRAEATEARVLQAALPASGSVVATVGRPVASARGAAIRRELGTFGTLGVLVLLLTVVCGSQFASKENLLNVLAAASLVSIAAAGMAQVLIVGGIDISIGSMLGLTGAIACTAAGKGLAPLAVVALGMALGAAFGGLNAVAAYRGRIHPIIVTLAGIYIYRGLMIRFTGGYEVSGLPPGFRALTDGGWLGVPKIVWIAAVVHAGNGWFLSRTLPGRRLYAVGGSPTAAMLAGVKPERFRLLAFAISGAMVGLTAVLWGAYFGKIQSSAGNGFELQVIAAAVVGGCAVTGGRGRAVGVVAGSVLIAVVYNALILLQISSYWQGVFVGLLILGATGLDMRLRGAGKAGA